MRCFSEWRTIPDNQRKIYLARLGFEPATFGDQSDAQPTELQVMLGAGRKMMKLGLFDISKQNLVSSISRQYSAYIKIIMGQWTRVEKSNEMFLQVTNHTGQAEKNLLGPAGIRTCDLRLVVRCLTNWATGQVWSWSPNDRTRAIWYFETESSFFHI